MDARSGAGAGVCQPPAGAGGGAAAHRLARRAHGRCSHSARRTCLRIQGRWPFRVGVSILKTPRSCIPPCARRRKRWGCRPTSSRCWVCFQPTSRARPLPFRPVVALVQPPGQLQPNPHEVAEVFEVPLAFLLNPAHHRRHVYESGGIRREWFSMPYEYGSKSYYIWGATAGMLRNFYRFLMA